MAQVLVRNLDERIVDSLKTKASLHGRSLEQELREILTQAAEWTREEKLAFADAIRERTLKPYTTDAAEEIRRMREEDAR
jgi:antitoxin FitA